MAKYQPFTDWLNDLTDKLIKVEKETNEEYFDNLEKKLKKNYSQIIDYFYSSYDPSFYKRRGSLYDLLVINRDSKGLEVGFDPSKISRRDGFNGEQGLYTTVFKLGYHGGSYVKKADDYLIPWTNPAYTYDGSISPWENPKPWIVNPKVKHGWKPAERTVASPYRMWLKFISNYNKGQYQKDYNEIFYRNYNRYFK